MARFAVDDNPPYLHGEQVDTCNGWAVVQCTATELVRWFDENKRADPNGCWATPFWEHGQLVLPHTEYEPEHWERLTPDTGDLVTLHGHTLLEVGDETRSETGDA